MGKENVMSSTLCNSSKRPKKPAGKAKAKSAAAKRKSSASKAKNAAASAKTKPKKATAKKTKGKAVQKSVVTTAPGKKTRKKASTAKKTVTQKDIRNKSTRTAKPKTTRPSKKTISSRAKAEKKIKSKIDKKLIITPEPMPEEKPELRQAESHIPDPTSSIEHEIPKKYDELKSCAENTAHDNPKTEIAEAARRKEEVLPEKEESGTNKKAFSPFARMLKLVRRPEKAAERKIQFPVSDPKIKDAKLDPPGHEIPDAEKAKDTEAVVDRVAVLLDAIAGTTVEMESKIRAESESGLAAVYDASNLLADSMPQTSFQTETDVINEAAVEDESGTELRFSLDTFFREDRVTPLEGEEPIDDSDQIAPVLTEVGDIFQSADDKDLIAEINNDLEQSAEATGKTEIAEDAAEPELASSEDSEENLPEPEDDVLEETASEEEEPAKISNKVVLLRSAEDVRPQIDTPDFADRRRRPKRPWTLDVEIALRDLMGDVPDPTRIDFDQMVMAWKRGYESYFANSLAEFRFPYIWADVNQVNLGDGIKKTFLSFTGCDLKGQRKLLALIEGDPDSTEIWQVMLKRLERRDLGNPRLFIGKSDLPLWEVLPKVFPRAQAQYCWNDFSRKISGIFPKEFHRNVIMHVNKIRHAPDQQDSESYIDDFKSTFGADYPRAVTEFMKCKEDLLRYYSYPSKHWNYIKTSGKVSGYFPTETLMKTVCKFEQMRDVSIYLIFNYLLRSQRRWMRIKGARMLKCVQSGRRYFDGLRRPPKKNKKSRIAADKKSTGNMLHKMMPGISSGFGSLFGKPRNTNRKYKTQPEAGQAKARPAVIPGNTSANNLSDPKSELEDLLRDRMRTENSSKAQKLPVALQALEKIKPGIKPRNDVMSGMEREILEELNSEKN